MEFANMHWGFRVKQLRNEKGLSAAEFARRAGLSPSYITKMEKGIGESPRDVTVNKMAHAFNMSPTVLRQYLFGEPQSVRKETTLELLERVESSLPVEIPVYSHYPYAPGEAAVTTLYHSRTEGLSRNIKGYLVHGSTLEPDYRDREIIIVDHDIAPDNGDEVVYLQNDEMKVGKFKKAGGNDYIESRHQTLRYEDARSCAVIVFSYMLRRTKNLGLVALTGIIAVFGLLCGAVQALA